MGTIDKTDMLLSSVECVRRTMKWYKKLFFHIVDMSLLNAYSAYKIVTGKHISLADFQFKLINELILKYQCKDGIATNRRKKPSTIQKIGYNQTLGTFQSWCHKHHKKKKTRKTILLCLQPQNGKQKNKRFHVLLY
jgi:hypothetical protein